MKKIIYILILALFTACGASRTPEKISRTLVKDSIWREVQYIPVDTTFTIPGDSLRLTVPLSEIGKKPVVKASENGSMIASVSKKSDTLIVDCKVEELERQISFLKEVLSEYRHRSNFEFEKIVVPKPYVPNIVKTLAWFGGLFIALIIIILVLRLKKILNPLKL